MTRANSTALRRAVFNFWKRRHPIIASRWVMYCHICDHMIEPMLDTWEAEHVVPHALGGSDDPENVRPCCVPCHRAKTRNDVTAIAKGKRVADRLYGIKRSRTPMAGGKRSKWKKRMDGTVVPRE
jgi:5-methylcytosine-specific restriction endonuclease McrA